MRLRYGSTTFRVRFWDGHMTKVRVGGNGISFIQRSDEFFKPFVAQSVNRHHVFSEVVRYGIGYLTVPS